MTTTTNEEQVVRAQAHVVGLLNEVEAVLTGWVLGEDREKVSSLTGPLYDLCDKEPRRPATRRLSPPSPRSRRH